MGFQHTGLYMRKMGLNISKYFTSLIVLISEGV